MYFMTELKINIFHFSMTHSVLLTLLLILAGRVIRTFHWFLEGHGFDCHQE